MIYETRINLRNKTKEELIMFVNEGLETIKKYQAELEKKDLIINEMAKLIAGLDIDELICKDREHCTGDYEYETCEECIKEYFTNKAENVGE